MVTKKELTGVDGYRIERVHQPSHIRRGRLAVDPVWVVVCPSGQRVTFKLQREARAFIRREREADAEGPSFTPSGPDPE